MASYSTFIQTEWRCGYIAVPEGHVAYQKDYDDINCECHGGLTFAGYTLSKEIDEHIETPHYWFGFDCNHYNDTPERWTFEAVEKEVNDLAEYFANMKTPNQLRKF